MAAHSYVFFGAWLCSHALFYINQLQRKVETALREQRDILRTAKTSGLKDVEREAKEKISILTGKYNKLSKASGLPTKMERTKSALKVDKLKGNGTIEYKGLSAKISRMDIPEHQEPEFIKTIDYSNKKAVLNELKIFEQDAINKNIETAIVVLKDGNVYKCYGVKDRVFPDSDLGEQLRGASVSHNHPIDETLYTFSKDDLHLFVEYELEILHGCDEKYIYEFSREYSFVDSEPNDWMNYENFAHADIIRLAKEYKIGYRRWLNDTKRD